MILLIIDQFGDAVMNCRYLSGEPWRHSHDTGKLAIMYECLNAGLVHDCEVYGLFADLIPAQAVNNRGESLEWGRARQGLVPDFKIRLPTPEGLTLLALELVGPQGGLGGRGQTGGQLAYHSSTRGPWIVLIRPTTAPLLGRLVPW
jgi:hypothetical protein